VKMEVSVCLWIGLLLLEELAGQTNPKYSVWVCIGQLVKSDLKDSKEQNHSSRTQYQSIQIN
jgi:hypothetical protein